MDRFEDRGSTPLASTSWVKAARDFRRVSTAVALGRLREISWPVRLFALATKFSLAMAVERQFNNHTNLIDNEFSARCSDRPTASRRPRIDSRIYRQHILHVESNDSFSIAALVWRRGQATPVHDHISWCVVGVYKGESMKRSTISTTLKALRICSSGVALSIPLGQLPLSCPRAIFIASRTPETKLLSRFISMGQTSLHSVLAIPRRFDLEVRADD